MPDEVYFTAPKVFELATTLRDAVLAEKCEPCPDGGFHGFLALRLGHGHKLDTIRGTADAGAGFGDPRGYVGNPKRKVHLYSVPISAPGC
jgi:hypothetical protein